MSVNVKQDPEEVARKVMGGCDVAHAGEVWAVIAGEYPGRHMWTVSELTRQSSSVNYKQQVIRVLDSFEQPPAGGVPCGVLKRIDHRGHRCTRVTVPGARAIDVGMRPGSVDERQA